MSRFLSFASLTLALLAAPVRAAPPAPDEGRPIVIGRSYELASKTLGDVRRINVYLPEHYGEAGKAFPVVYLLDGGETEDFHQITALAQITAAYGEGRELIVVGIEGKDRRHDLTSPSQVEADRKLLPTSGGAAAYRRFLVEELKPWVAARYRTDGHAALMGESLAGLFTAQTLLEAPESFDDYIVVSPSLWWNGGALSREAAADLKAHTFAGKRAFIAFDDPAPPKAAADKERAQQASLQAAFVQVHPKGLAWRVIRPGEGHSTIYHPAAMQAFRSLYAVKGALGER